MNRIIFLIVVFAMGALLFSCAQNQENSRENFAGSVPSGNLESSNSEYLERALHTARINSITQTDSGHVFSLKVETPDPCWEIHRYEIAKKDGEIYVTVIGRRDKEKACIQTIGSTTTEVPLLFEGPGDYKCRFWCHRSETLDTTVTVQ